MEGNIEVTVLQKINGYWTTIEIIALESLGVKVDRNASHPDVIVLMSEPAFDLGCILDVSNIIKRRSLYSNCWS